MKYLARLIAFCTIIFAIHAHAQGDLPDISIGINNNPADGNLYLATLRRNSNQEDTTQRHLLVLNNDGEFIYQQAVGRVFNFGQTPDGERYYYQFTDNGLGRGAATDGSYIIIDEEGNTLREYTVQGDYPTQAHDILFLENGHVLLLSQPVRTVDLTAYGGHEEAQVVEAVIQELDAENNIVFEWRSWEHLDLNDTANLAELTIAPPEPVSYLHVNAFTVDTDGNIIFSARRFDELIKIDRNTGEIIWRMGGQQSRNNQFIYINDPFAGFSGQHHVQLLENGNLLLFDNGNADSDHPARALEYQLDQENFLATLVWSFTDRHERTAPAMGSVQRLANGNTLIGWGTAPSTGENITEVSASGEVVFTLSLPENLMSYRVYRFDN